MELQIFVGYSADAREQALVVDRIAGEFQRELQRFGRDEAVPFRSVKVWLWERDLDGRPRGHAGVVDKVLETAHLGIFVFRERLGEGTRAELEYLRARVDQPPIVTLYPAFPPERETLLREDGAAAWANLMGFPKEVGEGWLDDGSRPIVDREKYRDDEHLRELVLEQFKVELDALLERHRRPMRAPEGPVDADDGLGGEDEGAQPFIDQPSDVAIHDPDVLRAYRDDLVPEERADYPPELDGSLFLDQARYRRDGQLTRVGVLLFTRSPREEPSLPMALTQCVRYHGHSKAAERERERLQGPVADSRRIGVPRAPHGEAPAGSRGS